MVVIAGMNYLSTHVEVQQLRVDDPSGKIDVLLKERISKANTWHADIYVSCHHNALGGIWGDHGGIETYVMNPLNKNPSSFHLAKLIHPRVQQVMDLRDRGIKPANFFELRETKMPAVLIEGGFMDSKTDIIKLRNKQYLLAQGEAIAKGIIDFLDLNLMLKPEEPEMDLLEKAIAIASFHGYPAAEVLSIRLKIPIYPLNAIKRKVSKVLIVVGGNSYPLNADKIINLSGKNRDETAANVAKYIEKL